MLIKHTAATRANLNLVLDADLVMRNRVDGIPSNPFELTHEPEYLQHTDIEGVLVSVPQVGRHGRVGFSELLCGFARQHDVQVGRERISKSW